MSVIVVKKKKKTNTEKERAHLYNYKLDTIRIQSKEA